MKLKKLLLTTLSACVCCVGMQAQTYYDITSEYLTNASFDTDFDYDKYATGDTTNVLSAPAGWTFVGTSNPSMPLLATIQYGTAKTFGGFQTPALGADGTAQGGALMCYAGGRIRYTQTVKLPAGKYLLVTLWYNCNPDATAGSSLTGWIAGTGTSLTAASTKTVFPSSQWTADTVSFELTATTQGKIQLGFRGSYPFAGSAIPAIDYVKLLRDTPIGDQDFSGDEPTVTTNIRFARGATMAFGRMAATIGDGTISERGFCWSETPEPTVNDQTTTEMLGNGVYVLRDLKPATMYYMRAYAKTEGRRVGYGQVIKFSTLPKGEISYWYNNGGDDAANARVNAAATEACNIFNNLTSIHKHYNIGYSSGTPTADCYYADEPWMNMGANASYQRTGTIMHEMQHGLGLVPYTTQWNKNILRASLDGEGRGTGLWLGDRVSAFLDFWDNTSGSHLNGDYQHMWPYGINGASEDNGTLELYYGNAMIGQALGEDGLEHRTNTFADPCYIFTHDDNVKYYLKNESADRGLYTSYLIPTATGTLQWRTMTAAEAAANDSVAWYVTFKPTNQYYQLRNAATGQYLTYASSTFRTITRSTLTANDNFHLMRSRVDVGTGEATGPVVSQDNTRRAYWLIHPTNNWTPTCIQANANGIVGSATFNIANTASSQRWLILTADEMAKQEQDAITTLRQQMANLLTPIKALLQVPHVELADGTDATFAATLADLEQQLTDATSPTDILSVETVARQAAFVFLSAAKPTDAANPFDLSYMIQNPGMDSTDGWSASPTLNYSCAEFYEKTFNFNQNITGLPAGNYRIMAQGFQRPGSAATAYNDYVAGTNNVTAYLYAGNDSQQLAHIASEAQTAKLGGSESTVGGNKYIPNNMQAASIYFARGLYQNAVSTSLGTDNSAPAANGYSLRIGLRSSSMPSTYWVIFDNFRLQYLGRDIPGDVNNDGQVGIGDIVAITNVMAGTETSEAVKTAADVNNDGEVGIGDIVAVTNIMAGNE